MLIYSCLMETTTTEWLATALKNSGMTQTELSRKSGVSEGHLSKVLKGERALGKDALRSIAEALDITPEQAFRDTGLLPPAPERTELHERLIFAFDKLKREPGLHDFRRGSLLEMLRNKMDVVTVSRIAGHSDIRVTMRYLAQLQEDLLIAHRQASPVDNMF